MAVFEGAFQNIIDYTAAAVDLNYTSFQYFVASLGKDYDPEFCASSDRCFVVLPAGSGEYISNGPAEFARLAIVGDPNNTGLNEIVAEDKSTFNRHEKHFIRRSFNRAYYDRQQSLSEPVTRDSGDTSGSGTVFARLDAEVKFDVDSASGDTVCCRTSNFGNSSFYTLFTRSPETITKNLTNIRATDLPNYFRSFDGLWYEPRYFSFVSSVTTGSASLQVVYRELSQQPPPP